MAAIKERGMVKIEMGDCQQLMHYSSRAQCMDATNKVNKETHPRRRKKKEEKQTHFNVHHANQHLARADEVKVPGSRINVSISDARNRRSGKVKQHHKCFDNVVFTCEWPFWLHAHPRLRW